MKLTRHVIFDGLLYSIEPFAEPTLFYFISFSVFFLIDVSVILHIKSLHYPTLGKQKGMPRCLLYKEQRCASDDHLELQKLRQTGKGSGG